MADVLFNGRRLEELKVVEIRDELAKRNLPRKGIKSTLIKRFEKVLLKELQEQQMPFEGQPSYSNASEENVVSQGDTEDDEVQGHAEHVADKERKDDSASEVAETQQEASDQNQPEENKTSTMQEEETAFEEEQSEQPPADDDEEEEANMEVYEDVPLYNIDTTDETAESVESITTNRLESVTSIIEPTFTKEEELIYEGDVDNDETEENTPMELEMELDAEDDKDELIVDFTPGELELDPHSNDRQQSSTAVAGDKTVASGSSNKSNDKVDSNKEYSKGGDTKEESTTEERCNVWVSGLSQVVTASDLKTLFSPFGQVVSAKVVARARSSKNQRYGFVTMSSPEQAEKSIQSLNNTELKGQRIIVELTRNSPFVSKQNKGQSNRKSSKTPPKDSSDAKKSSTSSKQAHNKGGKSGSKNDTPSNKGGTNKGGSNISNSSDKSSNSGSKRIIAVEKNDGRKELYTASGKRRRDEQRDVKRPRSRSPRPRSPRPPSPPRSRIRSRSPRIRRNTSPHGRIVSRLSPVRRISSGGARRGVSPPYRRPPSPIRRRVPSPPLRRAPSPPPRRGGGEDVRRDLMRREIERREIERRDIRNRLGGRIAPAPPPPPPSVREVEMRMEEQRQRMLSERERERVALRREIELKNAHREQELQRRLQEVQQREERERSLLDRQQREFMQLQRSIKERESHIEAREREIKEKEMRERQRFESLERQKEKDYLEKEKRIREEIDRDYKQKAIELQREQEAFRMKLKEQERALVDKERQIRLEQERLAREKEEAERKQRRKEEEKDRDRDRKDRDDGRRGGHIKEEDDKERISKRSSVDESIFGRLGNRDSQHSDTGSSSRSSTTAIVKETQISPNVMYRRIESSNANKPVSNNRGVANPYSQNQSRSKALDSLSANYATPRHSNNPVGYPQPSRYSSQTGYSSSTTGSGGGGQSVGYGSSNTPSNSSGLNQFNKVVSPEDISNLLSVLSNVTRGGSNVPPSGGSSSLGGSGRGGYSSGVGLGGAGPNSMNSGRFYRGGSGMGGGGMPPSGGGNVPGGGGGSRQGFSSGPGVGMSQSQFTKHMNKVPSEYDHYNRRAPPRSTEPYSHFNKRM